MDDALQFLYELAMQEPEKPDHWCSCGQCESNSNKALDTLEAMFGY